MKKVKGFTLLELLLVLAIFSISLGLGIAPMISAIEKNQIRSTSNSLLSIAQFIRASAIRSGTTYVLCPSIDKNQCDRTTWTQTLIAFSDTNNNRRRDSDEEISRYFDLPDELILKWRASGHANYLRFNDQGHAITFGSFYICNKMQPVRARRIAISRTGRASLHADRDGDGISDSVTNPERVCN